MPKQHVHDSMHEAYSGNQLSSMHLKMTCIILRCFSIMQLHTHQVVVGSVTLPHTTDSIVRVLIVAVWPAVQVLWYYCVHC